MGGPHFAAWPVALYGAVLLLAGCAYFILSRVLIAHDGTDSALAAALGADFKGKASLVLYAVPIPLSFVNRWFACALYKVVAVMWVIPDRATEAGLTERVVR